MTPAPASPMARVDRLDCLLELPPGRSLRVDAEGRWQAARLEGRLYRRVLDGTVVAYPERRGPPVDADAPELHARVRALAEDLWRRFADDAQPLRLVGQQATRERLLALLALARDWTPQRFADEVARYRAAYDEPVEILPPDRYRDLVLLPATGCPYARCSFCAFYRDRAFRIKDDEQLARHLQAIEALFGAPIALRTGIFLGSASALSLSQARLLDLFARIEARGWHFARGVAAFWDPDHSPDRDEQQWLALHQRGLTGVYVGLETGLAELRARIGKSGDIERLVQAIARQRRAAARARLEAPLATALRTGVIVLAGVGGAELASAHREATAEVIARLPLERRDVVFISGLADALPAAQLDAELRALQQRLRAATPARVVPYAMDAFRYFS